MGVGRIGKGGGRGEGRQAGGGREWRAGGRGAHIEAVGGADRGQLVVALVALRKKTKSRAVGRADAGQT